MKSRQRKFGRIWRGLALLCALAAFPAGLAASAESFTGLKLSGKDPVQIESDQLEVRESEHIAVFTGNVAVVQGKTLLKAGKLVVHYANDGGSAATGSAAIERLEVSGKVYLKSENQIATGDEASFDAKSEIMVLTGKRVVLSEGDNIAIGQKLTVHMKTGRSKLDGRVSMVLTPKGSPKN